MDARKQVKYWEKKTRTVKYHLYDDQERHQGRFDSVQDLRNFLCDRKYNVNCDKDIGCTFDYIKSIKWFFEIEE